MEYSFKKREDSTETEAERLERLKKHEAEFASHESTSDLIEYLSINAPLHHGSSLRYSATRNEIDRRIPKFIKKRCVWCHGVGYGGDRPDYYSNDCIECKGKGEVESRE